MKNIDNSQLANVYFKLSDKKSYVMSRLGGLNGKYYFFTSISFPDVLLYILPLYFVTLWKESLNSDGQQIHQYQHR
jgi:hypothetical protein